LPSASVNSDLEHLTGEEQLQSRGLGRGKGCSISKGVAGVRGLAQR
jgi:hypothetical protein